MTIENTRKWENNIKTNIKETGCIGLKWNITGTSKHGNKHSGSADVGQLLGCVTLKFLKKDFAPLFVSSACNGAS